MAKAKTGSFYLTETVSLAAATAANTRVQTEIDLGAFVSAPQSIGVAIESVDFIYQVGTDYGGNVNSMLDGNGSLTAQVTDNNPGTAFVRADSQSLVASGTLCIDDANNIATHTSDLFPDNFGPSALSEAFLCVSDSLFFVAGNDLVDVHGSVVSITARIKMRCVKLSAEDWVGIAIQATSD